MFERTKRFVRRFIADRKGLETLEYAIITGLIVAGTIGVIAALGAWILAKFSEVQQTIGA